MMNRNIVFLAVSIFAILMIFSISSFADKSEQVTVKSKVVKQVVLPVISSDKNQNVQTGIIEPIQTISEEIAGQEPCAPDNVSSLSAPVNLSSSTRAGEQINWQVISGGGTDGSSTNFNLSGTVGQTAVGEGSSTSYGLTHGYWQSSASGGCDCEPGEADGTEPINILDVVYIINYKYKSGPAAVPYKFCNADADCSCVVNILDVVYLINYKYKSGPAMCACEVWVSACGALH